MSELDQSLARSLVEVTQKIFQETDLQSALEVILRAAVDAVPGAAFGGISLLERGTAVVAEVQSDPLVTEIDGLQTRLQEGPCLASLTGHRTVVANDLRVDTRWPAFAAEATARGVNSAMALSLELRGDNANLSLFATTADAFDDEALQTAELFAMQAAVALAGVRRVEQLNKAVRSRDLIGMAKGIIMAEHGLTEEQAFHALVRLSQLENVKLVDVAGRLVELQAP